MTTLRALSSDFVTTAVDEAGWPAGEVPEIAFAGRSNVGKSSALNALTGRKSLARVSNTPGRTRTINFFHVRLADASDRRFELRFADLPGYGFARASHDEKRRWKAMVETYLGRRGPLCAVVVLVDANVGPTELDHELLDWLRSLGREAVVLATKVDKISRSRRPARLREVAAALGMAPSALVPISAREKTGLDDAWKRIAEACKLG